MPNKPTVMVDLDDTLVSFSEMFCDAWNRYIRTRAQYFSGANTTFTINDITEYSFLNSLHNFYKNNKITGREYLDSFVDHFLNEILFVNESLYDNPYLTPEYHKIMKILWNDFKGYKKILHTKVSSPEMMIAKAKLFKANKDFQIFDEIILDMERGEHSPKPYNYDVMVDDAPHNIEYYLENNKKGLVYMPVRPWNEKYKNNERVIIL
jgi:FMN phosphatase YigB (HAD superfamily)